MLKVVLLGSTGSLGRQSLQILEKYPQHFKVIALSANKNAELLAQQKKQFKPQNVLLSNSACQKELQQLASLNEADIVINVLPGLAGVKPSIAALRSKRILLLGNKESLVAEGKKVIGLAKWKSSKQSAEQNLLIPLDSEHNAIHEILKKYPGRKVKNIFLPCSGGPFINKTKKELENISVAQALNHPKWKMGNKISIESATLLNKGFEIIEAHYLFDLPLSKIKVFLHQQCEIHGAVEFQNGETVAYSSRPNMQEHIENALLEVVGRSKKRNIAVVKGFSFAPPKNRHLQGIKLVKSAFKNGPLSMQKFLRNEEKAVNNFLSGKSTFLQIFEELST